MILVITGRDEPEDLQTALEAGANDYLIKPVSMQQLKVRLTTVEQLFHNLIRRKRVEKAFKESLMQIERAKQEWESTADSLSLVVCLLDSQGRVVRANRSIEHWNLGRVTKVEGQGIHELFHPNCTKSDCYLKKFLSRAWGEIVQGKSVECEAEDRNLQRYLHIQVRPISTQTRRNSKKTESFAVFVATDITSHKEIQDTLSKQDRLLLGVAGAMNHLLITLDFSSAITKALKAIGLAANADRVYIFETHTHPETNEPLMSQRFEWDCFSAETQVNNPVFQNIPYRIGFSRWYETLSANNSICGLIRDLPPEEREMLDQQNIMSILMVPITIHERFWGFIGFDDCHSERAWRGEEEAVLFAMAGSIGGAIARKQAEEQLRQTSSELRAVFQSLPDEYFRLGSDGSILDYGMEQVSELYLYPETFIGKWALGILPDEVERQFDAAITQVHKTKKLVRIEYKLLDSDQEERYEEVRLVPFLQDQLIIVARDITKCKQVDEELRRRCDHLEKLVQECTAELRTANEQLQQEMLKRKQTEGALHELAQKFEDGGEQKSNLQTKTSHALQTSSTR